MIGAVAWRDLRRVISGRKRFSLPLLALFLLLPVGALPLPAPEAPTGPPPTPAVQGEVPAALGGQLRVHPDAAVRLEAGPPVVAEGAFVPARLRAVLDTLDGDGALSVRYHRPPLRLPGRSMLVALLAISLLTGPLAESLPGEREEGTFETLLAAALSHGELIVGKWLAWTAAASAAALLSSISGRVTGAQAAGPWLFGVPLSLAVAVASGLWLVRRAGDVIGGAAAPMRVIPSLAVMAVGLAWLAAQAHPLLGAALPLGGALLLAGGMLDGALPVLVCTLSTAATVAVLLAGTARDLQRTPSRRAAARWGLAAGAALCWWLPVTAPAAWGLAGRAELVDPASGVRAAGLLALLLAATAAARDTQPVSWRRPGWPGLLLAVAAGGGLALLSNLPTALPVDGVLAARLLARPTGLFGAVALAVGGEALFRGVLSARLGMWPALALWVLIVHPLDPILGLASGLALGWLARNHGLTAAIVGALVWHVS